MIAPSHCCLCPRRCGADRTRHHGLCHGGRLVRVARAAPHHWEEPCLSGSKGSGTVFFSGCSLGCVFCQNHSISHHAAGRELSVEQLAEVFLHLQAQAVHNLNLVTAAHYRPWVQQALLLAKAKGFSLPVVWNTGGYETLETIEALRDLVAVWLFDLKFFSADLSQELAAAPDYFALASQALKKAHALAGAPRYTADGLLAQGVLVRLPVLPGQYADAENSLRFLADSFPADSLVLSLMSQYTPPEGLVLPKPLNRRLASYEYRRVCETAQALGFKKGYMQQRSSASARFLPNFDGTGVLP